MTSALSTVSSSSTVVRALERNRSEEGKEEISDLSSERLWIAKIKVILVQKRISAEIFGAEEWEETFGLSQEKLGIENAPILDSSVIASIEKVASLKIEGDAGVTLFLVPLKTSLIKIVCLAKAPTDESRRVQFSSKKIWSRALEAVTFTAEKPFWVVITNAPLKGSRNLTPEDQRAFVTKVGCEMPEALIAVLLDIISYAHFHKTLYADDSSGSSTYTRCSNRTPGDNRWISVGGFDERGPYITSQPGKDPDTGVAAMLTLDRLQDREQR